MCLHEVIIGVLRCLTLYSNCYQHRWRGCALNKYVSSHAEFLVLLWLWCYWSSCSFKAQNASAESVPSVNLSAKQASRFLGVCQLVISQFVLTAQPSLNARPMLSELKKKQNKVFRFSNFARHKRKPSQCNKAASLSLAISQKAFYNPHCFPSDSDIRYDRFRYNELPAK